MARKKIREYDSKRLLKEHLKRLAGIDLQIQSAQITESTDFTELVEKEPWLSSTKLVVKPDVLLGKSGLVALNLDIAEVSEFVKERLGVEVERGGCKVPITTFIVEPFVPHEDEYYLSIVSESLGCTVSFSECCGIEVEGDWDKVKTVFLPIGKPMTSKACAPLIATVPLEVRGKLGHFIKGVFSVFQDLDFSFIEMDPFTLVNGELYLLDMRGELDGTTAFKNFKKWGDIEFPLPFGEVLSPTESFIHDLYKKMVIIHDNGLNGVEASTSQEQMVMITAMMQTLMEYLNQQALQHQQAQYMALQAQLEALKAAYVAPAPPGIREFREIDPPFFAGIETPIESEEFLCHTKDLLTVLDVPKADWVAIVKLQLTHGARYWWDVEERCIPKPISWETFKEHFDAKFFPETVRRDLQDRFFRLKQGNLSVDEYDNEFLRLYRYAPKMDEKDEVCCFRNGLTVDLQLKLAAANLNTHAEALAAARRCEAAAKRCLQVGRSPPPARYMLAPVQTSSFKKAGAPQSAQPIQSVCGRCKETGHLTRDC